MSPRNRRGHGSSDKDPDRAALAAELADAFEQADGAAIKKATEAAQALGDRLPQQQGGTA